jgi:hypothetical protein
MSIPWWLQAILGVTNVLAPQLAWLSPVIQAAYNIWLNIPWFHKAGALVELRKVVKDAQTKNSSLPIHGYNERWSRHSSAIADASDLV